MNKWEYTWLFLQREASLLGKEKQWFLYNPDSTKVEGQQINAKIQKLGDEGWELVAVVPISNLVLGRYADGWINGCNIFLNVPNEMATNNFWNNFTIDAYPSLTTDN